jgi:hypothetical protein
MTSTPRTIRATVGPKVLTHAADFFNHGPETIFSELLQNSRRAGATAVNIQLTPTDGETIVRFEDDGSGIANPADLLRFGGSGWNDVVEERERPAGMGFYSLAAAGVFVASRDWSMTLTPAAFRGEESVEVADVEPRTGTLVEFAFRGDPKYLRNAIKSESKYAPIDVYLEGDRFGRTDFLAKADRILETHGVRIGVCSENGYGINWDQRLISINYFGHVVTAKTPPYRSVHYSVGKQPFVINTQIDVVDASALRLVLPARNGVVEDEGFDAIVQAAITEMYRHLETIEGAVYSHDTYAAGRALGVELPIPTTAMIQGWYVGNEEDEIEYSGPFDWYAIDLTDGTNRAGFARLPFFDGFVGRAVAQALEAWNTDFKLTAGEKDFVGYPGYDAIPDATFTLRIQKDDGPDIRIAIDSEDDLDMTEIAAAFGAYDSRTSRATIVDALEFEMETPSGTHTLPIDAISLSDDRWTIDVLVRRGVAINKLATALHEQTWRASDEDDSDAKSEGYAEMQASLRRLLLATHDATALQIRDLVAQQLVYLMGRPAGIADSNELVVREVLVTRGSQNEMTVTVSFSDGQSRITQTR